MKNLYNLLLDMDIPVAYRKFNEVTSLPYIVYYITSNSDIYADNINYVKRLNITIDLYTDYKDIELEYNLENLLINNKIPYSKEEYYIESEDMYINKYFIQIISGFKLKDIEELPDAVKYDIGFNLVDPKIKVSKINLDKIKEE